jgi:transcriptional regulator with XRE-family HTH domain
MPLDVNKIREARTAKGFTLNDVARGAGLNNRQHLCDIERGRKPDPRFSTIAKVARFLGISIDDLWS